MNWLNAIDTDDEENTSEGTGLLLAPINQQPVNEPVFPVVTPQSSTKSPEQHEPGEVESIMQELQNWKNDLPGQKEVIHDETETLNFSQDNIAEDENSKPDDLAYDETETFSSDKSYEGFIHTEPETFSGDDGYGRFTHKVSDEFSRNEPETFSDDSGYEIFTHKIPDELSQNELDFQDFPQDFHTEPETSEFVLNINSEEEISDDNNDDENYEDYDNETSEISHELHDLQEAVKNLQGTLDVDVETEDEHDTQAASPDTQENSSHEQTETSSSQLNPDWKNANTGFELSLDEPPPEIWTKINAEKENPEDLDYEETESLQGAAYIPKPEHGKNFTQRLQKTLQNRKQKAEAERELEAEQKSHHPYLQKAMIICGTLLIVLFFAWLSLCFIQRETPEGMNARAEKFYEQGNYEEAEKLYQRAYKRYPNILTFLTRLADSAEKAGHSQTAEDAKREYARNFPDEQNEIIIIPTSAKKGDDQQTKQENSEQKTESKPEKSKTEPVKITQPNSVYHDEKLTFDEYLQEGTHAFNVGMYNRAVMNFFRAYDINSADPRPYIGLAGAYRAKGLYFDAKVILDEARKKFRRNPTIEMERRFLREAR